MSKKETSETKGMYEIPIAYVVEFEPEPEDNAPEGTKLYSGYIHHFLNNGVPNNDKLQINGPLIATTILKMPFDNLEYCLFAMMNLLRSDMINYTLQDEQELIKTNARLNLIQVTREDIIPGYKELLKTENNNQNENTESN